MNEQYFDDVQRLVFGKIVYYSKHRKMHHFSGQKQLVLRMKKVTDIFLSVAYLILVGNDDSSSNI